MPVIREAHEQYDAMTGTVALDEADFESWARILNLEGWVPLGMAFFFGHPPLGGGKAESAYTSLQVWAIERTRLRDNYAIPDIVQLERPVKVTQFTFNAEEVAFSEPSNAMAVLLRGSKRLTISVWDQAVQEAGLLKSDFSVVEEHSMAWVDGLWRISDNA